MNKHPNNICVCGHLYKDHGVFKCDVYSYKLQKSCLFGIGIDANLVDNCKEFKLDNLKYLEQLSESM